MSASDGTNNVAFHRITLIGSSGCGKTALANAFVNNVAIFEHQPTTDLTVYHSRVCLGKDGDSEDSSFHALLEIEDTWASNKVSPTKMHLLYDPWWPLTQAQAIEASIVDVKAKKAPKTQNKNAVCQCGHGRSDHEGGTGPCRVLPCTCDGFSEEIPSVLNPFSNSRPPELWGVPCLKDHSLKLCEDMDGAGWLCNAKYEQDGCRSGFVKVAHTKGKPRYRCEVCDYNLCEKCHEAKAKAMAHKEPEPHDVDRDGRKYRPLTRNRMAYFFVFDTNDIDSYKEALAQEKALKDYLKRKDIKTLPVMYLVGTKIDVDPDNPAFQSVQFSAKSKSERDSMRYKEVSSMKFEGVRRLFREVVVSIRSKQNLWLLEHGSRHVEGEVKLDAGCCLQ